MLTRLQEFGYPVKGSSVFEWINALYEMLNESESDNVENQKQIRLLKPLTSYFDSQMSNFPSTFTPYIKNLETILKANDCYPTNDGISDERLQAV
eukprot:CAMPEP_0117006060 /NCGR_PEP_ID=MMETSP0472-20121206/6432_1 /TAXON_ID=693140 ORGANISM="Tiarina fusus, Strain LIS" /NCGR_SAMPLE_ID=MMETSP0472 /ASSEMBLY_ACC=CAM_ASM_000603 /LENGTH=94 /DNA_ID=CAMNT_0004707435 /DNA_START=1369 /DNA_END=1650 /DNA_ORIENTATION=+